jgi:hypothetical protein
MVSDSDRAERDPSPRETESDGSSTPAGLRNIEEEVERLLLAALWGDGADGSGGGALLDGSEQSPLLLSSSSGSKKIPILFLLLATRSSRMISRALLALRGLARSVVVEDLGPKLDIDVRRFEGL